MVFGGEATHSYEYEEPVHLWANKVGPYHNPQETYAYSSLPLCAPEDAGRVNKKKGGIGEILEGNELKNSQMKIFFAKDTPVTKLCSVTLDDKSVDYLAVAISNHYWYQMYLDDLPIWGMLGEVLASEEYVLEMEAHKEIPHEKASETFIFTHKKFSMSYNGNRVIEVNLTSENPQSVKMGTTLEFSYSATWTPTTKSFEDRFNRYLDYSFFEHQIHWFSIFNSFMMVIFLCGLVTLILIRTLRNDYAKYTRDEEDMDGHGMGDDSGWKQVHGDVFRRPDHLMFYSALVGTGSQLIVLILTVILFAISGSLYVERGGVVTAFLVCYALSSIVAGYVSGGYYKQHFYPKPAPEWKKTLLFTTCFFPLIVFGVVFCLNLISIYYDTLNTIPIAVMLKVVAIWVFISFPLNVVGTVLGRQWNGKPDFPCRVTALPRPIPEGQWYTKPSVVIPVTGILPFGSIFIEMYFVFTSFWNYKFYYVYGFMLLVYVILVIVSICVTIVAIYFVLNAENYHWQWISFFSSGSTAVYVFVYSIYYFFMKTNMSGFLQTWFYFGYMFLFSFAMFLLCGTLGWMGSSVFVKRIYRNIKVD